MASIMEFWPAMVAVAFSREALEESLFTGKDWFLFLGLGF